MEKGGSSCEIVDLIHSLFIQPRPATIHDSPAQAISIKSLPSSPAASVPRSQTFPVRKKVPIKSAPLKPPDIGNVSLFPSVEESAQIDSATQSPRRIPLRSAITNVDSGNAFTEGSTTQPSPKASTSLPSMNEGKLRTLEAKLTEPLGSQIQPEPKNAAARRATLNELPVTPSRKTPRSTKLFSDLSPEQRERLDDLAVKFSNAIDFNECRSVLDELEFVFQLFNTSSPLVKPTQSNLESGSGFPLTSTAEHAYFAIKILLNQLNKTCLSLPVCIVQQIVENYAHKIPKPVRKVVEDWIITQKKEAAKRVIINEEVSPELCKTVTFKSEKDGRDNFPHQTDFHGFCKQRDMFYSIRENWTACSGSISGNNGGMITDRNKARMSFPPVSSSVSSRANDTLSFKVQSLFQINSKSTNLFHMASLFVSHYLLEARSLEVGGVPKDDDMKEFFQSNPNKLLQLNSRFSMGTGETIDNDKKSNLAFHKEFLLCSGPKFVQHVIDRLVTELKTVADSLDLDDQLNPIQLCRWIKDAAHLARLLGFTLFLPYNDENVKEGDNQPPGRVVNESIFREHARIRKYQTPPIDLNRYIENACRTGRLTAACPWVIEYLIACDPVALQLPCYLPVILTLFSLNRFILNVSVSSTRIYFLSTSNKNFLRFYMGVLFSSRKFPDSVFSYLQNQKCKKRLDSSHSLNDAVVDSLDEIGYHLTEYFFEENFNRMKRILSWGKLEVSHPAMTGGIRHIRPIPATDKTMPTSVNQPSKEKVVQTHLETTFFELYPAALKRSVDFTSERIAANFISLAKSQLFPTARSTLFHQGVYGVRAAEKCRVKMAEEMSKYFAEKCSLAIRLFLEQSATPSVLNICQRIAIRKAKEVGNEWIKNYITAGMFPDSGSESLETLSLPPQPSSSASTTPTVKVANEDPPFEILILIHRMNRKLQSGEVLDSQLIDKVLSCPSFDKSLWIFNHIIEWGMNLITFQPKALSSDRIRQLVNLWKRLWNPGTKLINARNLMILTNSVNQRDSWIMLGTVTQHLIAEGIINVNDLEQQCLALLSEEWPNETHRRISEFLILLLDTVRGRAEGQNDSSVQVLDWVAWLCSGQPDQE